MREGGPAGLLIVDDQPVIRASLKVILGAMSDLRVVGEAADGAQALARCRSLRPDLVLMDVRMPGMDGLEATRQIKAEFPETSVLILTAYIAEDILFEAVRAGAAGYVLKGDGYGRLVEAVRAVLNGETPIDQGLAMQLLRRLVHETVPPGRPEEGTPREEDRASALPEPLTPKEMDVLVLLARGMTNSRLATELDLSISTVRQHVEQIIAKLGVSDRTQAAVRAIDLGIIGRDAAEE